MSTHEVFVVLDPDFSGDLGGLSRSGHVWIVGTELNKATARQVWSRDPRPQWPTQGVTTFAGVAHDPDTLYTVLRTIDEHHGQHVAALPWQVIHVHGLDLGDVSEPRISGDLAEAPVRLLPEPSGFAIVRAGPQDAAADGASRSR